MLSLFVLLVSVSTGGFSTNNFFLNDGQHNSYNNHQQNILSTNTPFGIVRGIKVMPSGMPKADVSLPPVVQYLGIPYGSAPVGNHRFKMAISAPKWIHQPKDAFKPPPSCIQSGLPSLSEAEALKVTTAQRFDRLHRILPLLKPQSEDCLFMNLFVPERNEFRDSHPLPVLVLIHGDTDYGWGGANAINGTLLASFGQIVVVTLNYRLGIFGFLGRCDLNSCAGNAGLSDLVAALKMLSLILPSFGADPNAVTLLGWESGAALVSLLMASPITQPKGRLFRRAILLDGTALSPWAMANNPQDQFIQLAKTLQCSNSEGEDNSFTNLKNQKELISRILHCIQEQNLQNLTNAAKKVSNLSPTFLSAFAPLIDGQVVPNHPSLSFSPKYGSLFREIDLLVGTVQHPAQHLIADQDMQNGLNVERRDKILRTLVRNIFDFHRSEILQAILNEYTDWENPKNHSKSMRNGLMEILGDLLFTAPLIGTAKAHSLDEGPIKAANTFFFVFAHETNTWMKEQPNSGLQGSFTGDHLPYILGHPFTAGEAIDGSISTNKLLQFSPEDKQICRVMMTFMANFVKSGDPTRPLPISSQSNVEDRFQGLPWPQFSSQAREAYLEISTRPRVKNYYKNSNVQFWNGFIPILNKRGDKDIPEEHHFLPNHFERSSFFGQPRPFSTYHNLPFPPPPMPPTPFPKELRNKLFSSYTISTTTNRPPLLNETPIKQQKEGNNLIENTGRAGLLFLYNPTWGWLILFGVALTAINLCILVIFSRKCVRRNSNSKKKFHYQSYSSPSNNNNMQQPLPGLDMNFAALEPLLSTTTSTSTKGLIHLGPGISPICPRHGRAAQMLLAAAAANRSGMTAGGGGGSGGSSITTPPPPLQMNLSNNNSTIPPTQKVQANIVDGLSSLNGGACDGSRGNGGGTGFVGGQQQQQRAIEEVQV